MSVNDIVLLNGDNRSVKIFDKTVVTAFRLTEKQLNIFQSR